MQRIYLVAAGVVQRDVDVALQDLIAVPLGLSAEGKIKRFSNWNFVYSLCLQLTA